jgi:hypothetical protein
MADQNVPANSASPVRSAPFGPAKVIKKTTGLYKSKRFHFQLILPFSVAILSLIFGIPHLQNCPIQPRIPVFLVVQGAIGLLIIVIHIVTIVYIMCITKFKYLFICIIFALIIFLFLFLFAWFIAGNVWVFSVTKRVQFSDRTNTNSYCNGTLYQAAFWLLIAQYIMSVYFFCSLTWIPQSTQSPTNGVIKVRKQIPKIKRMLKFKRLDPPATHDVTITTRF